MAKNQAEYLEEIKKFSKIVPSQLMILAYGMTDDGKFVPLKVSEDGSLVVK